MISSSSSDQRTSSAVVVSFSRSGPSGIQTSIASASTSSASRSASGSTRIPMSLAMSQPFGSKTNSSSGRAGALPFMPAIQADADVPVIGGFGQEV